MNIEIGQIITQIIAFLLMLWVLKKFGWKPLLMHLEERKEKIKSELDFIESQKDAAKKLISEYQVKLNGIEEEARHKIQEAIAEGQTIANEMQAKAQESIQEAHLKIQSNIKIEIAKAQSQLKERLVNIVISITEKLLKETLNEKEHKKLIEEFIEEAKLK